MILIKTFLLFLVSHQRVDAGWEDYSFQNPPSTNTMISVGTGEYGKAYVGRATHGPQTAPGELILSGPHRGVHLAYLYDDYVKETGIKYYKKEDDCHYRWVSSSHGAAVHDAIENFSDSQTLYVGRHFAHNVWHAGKVSLEAFLMYYTFGGKAQLTPTYEVLTCTRIPKTTTKAPQTTTTTAPPTSTCVSNTEIALCRDHVKLLQELLKYRTETPETTTTTTSVPQRCKPCSPNAEIAELKEQVKFLREALNLKDV